MLKLFTIHLLIQLLDMHKTKKLKNRHKYHYSNRERYFTIELSVFCSVKIFISEFINFFMNISSIKTNPDSFTGSASRSELFKVSYLLEE